MWDRAIEDSNRLCPACVEGTLSSNRLAERTMGRLCDTCPFWFMQRWRCQYASRDKVVKYGTTT